MRAAGLIPAGVPAVVESNSHWHQASGSLECRETGTHFFRVTFPDMNFTHLPSALCISEEFSIRSFDLIS